MTGMEEIERPTAAGALEGFVKNHPGAIGFAYTPVSAPWFQLDQNQIPVTHGGARLDLESVFELRAFDGAAELRWWNVPGEGGHKTEITRDYPGCEEGDTYSRLLWGRVQKVNEPDWIGLFEARIGWLWVPFKLIEKEAHVAVGAVVALKAVEYLREDRYGNVSVVDERLVGLTEWENE
ncbi:MAG TPA: CRISPR-associated protein Csx19 [Pseudonocardiaceae bacterium]